MKKELRNVLLSGALVAGTLGSAMVFAQTGGQTGGAQTQTQSQPQMQEQAVTGSVPVAQGMARYVDMATVSLQDAVSAAQQATGVSTTPTSAELEVEDGFLVWEIEIGNQEIIVDAGDGSVLQTMQAEMEDDSESAESEDEEGEYEEDEYENAENESGENEGPEGDD